MSGSSRLISKGEKKSMLHIKDFSLESMDETHLKKLLEWRNSQRIRDLMYSDHEITIEEHEEWYRNINKNGNRIVKVFSYKDKWIGQVSFSELDQKNNKCSWGFYIGEDDAPKGSGSIMAYYALSYIFETYGIRKLCAEIIDFNVSSFSYHTKLGFVEEGRLVQHVYKNNNYVDVIIMALFKDNWTDTKKQLIQRYGG